VPRRAGVAAVSISSSGPAGASDTLTSHRPAHGPAVTVQFGSPEDPAAPPRSRVIRIASVPSPGQANPYMELFYGALAPYGVEVADHFAVTDEHLRASVGHIDAVHLHWSVEMLWGSSGRLSGRIRGLIGLWRWLRLARSLGIRVIWTVHDIEPHGGQRPLDSVGYRMLARYADLLICHDDWCRDEAISRFGARPESIIVMPHGNYDGVFPEPRSRDVVMKELGLDPSRRVLACLGGIRPYKGVEVALGAMGLLGSNYQLLVAGHAPDEAYGQRIASLASAAPNIRVMLGLSDLQRFADLHGVSDCLLLPYRKITGSAVILSAMTMGRAVVANDLPFFRTILKDAPEAGVVYGPNTPEALAAAVEKFFTLSPDVRHAAARRIADRYAWSTVVKPVGEWMQSAFRPRGTNISIMGARA
jgi:beta-1,4-mannosyltransferase